MLELALLRPLQRDAGMRVHMRSRARHSSTSHQHAKAPLIAPVEMYSRRREEGIGLRVGDAAELGTGTLPARIDAEIKPQLQVKAERRRN